MQVLVGLSGHVAMERETVVALFEYLIVKNGAKFEQTALKNCMVLLPDIPEAQVNYVPWHTT